jgi:heme-degrading monooxygenase HmoA
MRLCVVRLHNVPSHATIGGPSTDQEARMIVRLWHGRVNISKADEYAEFMKKRAAPDYSAVEGLQKLFFTRRDEGDVAHFLLITFWDSMESVKRFAGEHPEKAKYYPEDDDFLLEKEAESVMYEVFYQA